MKNARYLWVTALGLFVFASEAGADPASTDPVDNPNLQYDPDGIPLSATRDKPRQFTAEEISAIQKAEQKAALDKDWLLRNYERQMRAHAAANAGEDQSSNLYYQLSTHKELAKLAGLQVIDTDDQEGTVPVPHSDSGPAKLRPNPTSATASRPFFNSDLLKPLVTPLSAPDAAGIQNSYSSLLPLSMPSPLSDNPAPAPSPTKPDASPDDLDIQTPGMIAAEKDPLADTSSQDLNLDMLPGETVEQAKERQDTNTTLELPLPMSADELHKQQAVKLSVAGVAPGAQPAASAATKIKPVPSDDSDAPIPVNKEPQINPVRAPIANPFDILNR
jgi:hypothetical protein